MASINKITVGDVDYNISIPSGLTEEEQAQIRQNIGAVGQGESTVVQDGTYPEMTVGEATHAQTADDATNAVNAQKATADADGNNIPNTYVKLEDFDRLILEHEYPVGGKPYIQFDGMQTPAERWAGTSWEIDTDYTGRVLVGSGTGFALGATGGSETHTLQIWELTEHAHLGVRIKWNNDDIPSNADGLVDGDGRPLRASKNLYQAHVSVDYPSGYTENAGNSTPFSLMQPYKVVNIWKRTA